MGSRWEQIAPTKRELGVGYLAGAGVALALSLAGYVWFTRESILVLLIGTTLALALFVTIVYVGYLFFENDFSGEFVWNVAQWAALGLGGTSLLSLGVAVGRLYLPDSALVPSLIVITIATGGVVGTLIGVVAGLRNQHHRIREITQRNKVMNRVLRHNIKNAMNVVHGHAGELAREVGSTDHPSIAAITRTAEEVVSLSDAARKIDELDATEGSEPIELVGLVEAYVETARESYPAAELTTELPEEAWASAGPMLRSALANLVENAVEHADREPEVRISVRADGAGGDRRTVRVADNGPGIPADQIEVLFREQEAPTDHGNGLGLWLVKWVAETFDGRLRFEENEPRGTVVCLDLPPARPPTR